MSPNVAWLCVLTVLCLGGCAARLPNQRAVFQPREPVCAPSSTDAVPVTLPGEDILEWDESRGDGNRTLTEYWPDGVLKSKAWWWGHRVVTITNYDRSGRVRFSMTDLLVSVADLSYLDPDEWERSTWSLDLKCIYMVGNRKARDADLLPLFEDKRVKYMIVERCRNISRDAMRKMKSKLVREFPDEYWR